MSKNRVIICILLLTTAMCPLIFAALDHYVFSAFQSGYASVVSALLTMILLLFGAVVLIEQEAQKNRRS